MVNNNDKVYHLFTSDGLQTVNNNDKGCEPSPRPRKANIDLPHKHELLAAEVK